MVSGGVAKLLPAAQGIGLLVTILKASSPSEIDLAFASLAERPVDALLIGGDPLFNGRRDQLIAHAARQKIPVVFDTRTYTEAGGLVSYGADYALAFREAGAYAGRILRGAKPADLPVAQMSKVELVINAKTAKALGLTIPPAILTRADEVIE
jgi:putative ABC transport system substrate-binding protein